MFAAPPPICGNLSVMNLIPLTFACLSFAYAYWLLRSYRWPRVQAIVLKTWEEVTDVDTEGCASGWLHAELEYWYGAQHYLVAWRADLHDRNHLPGALWMAIHPERPEEPQPLPRWTRPVVVSVIGMMLIAASVAMNG